MSGVKSMYHSHVAWSKTQRDKFVAISSDVKLFEFTNQSQHPGASAQQQPQESGGANQTAVTTLARAGKASKQTPNQFMNSRLVATGPEISSFKAAACYPGFIAEDDTLVAISCGGVQNTGKIVLVCLRPAGSYSIDNFIHVDLVAKRAICNDVDWSTVNNCLLATAWDRNKVDNSLQIFDINRIIDNGNYSFSFSMTSNNRPVFDGCPSDSINSLKWFKKEQTLVCGSNNKQIRIFDTRDLMKPRLTTPSKAVHGLTVDSFSDFRLASYSENTAYIWDTRYFDKPLVTIVESKHISQISWCPTRNHAFSALMTGDDFVKIYDIQQASQFSEDFEAKIVERLIHPFAASASSSASPTATTIQAVAGSFGSPHIIPKQITSYDWHPNSEFRLIAISNTRDVIALNICDRITLNWSPICEIVWTKGKKILQCLDPRDERYKSLDDISVNMRHRAITNYGMIVEDGPHHQRGDDSDLIGLLRWVKLAKALDVSCKKSKEQSSLPGSDQSQICTEILGVGSLLQDSINQMPSRAEVKAINWKGAAANSCVMSPIRFQVYHSEVRSRALLLCDWIPDIDNASQTIPIIDYLEKEGNYMRAAAIAVFNMRLQRAIDTLTMGATRSDPNLSSVAMALSGYTGERTSMWRAMCQTLKGQLTNPYMKAMFAFLTSESDTGFHEIIDDKDLILADRVAFSLLYLPDDKLNTYLTDTMYTLVESGDLNGILLTGVTHDGLSLLQRYIEVTSDIQSVSLIVLHSLPSLICGNPRAQLWVECYRGMLDCWRLWHQRAQFDNLWYSNSNLAKPPNHILISCNCCGNTICKSQQHQQLLNQSGNSNIQSNVSYSSFNSSQVNNNSTNQPQQAVTTTDYHQSQQVASSVPVTISGVSVSSITSNSSASTVGSATTAVSAGFNLGISSSPSYSTTATGDGTTSSSSTALVTKLQSSARMSHPSPTSNPVGLPPGGTRGKSCKKCSFAKCSLCLTQLGSNQILFDGKNMQHLNAKNRRSDTNSKQSTVGLRTNPFSNWFSWCQTCRHGAHSAHLLSWFDENSECPVSGCDCKCMSLDSRTRLDDVLKS